MHQLNNTQLFDVQTQIGFHTEEGISTVRSQKYAVTTVCVCVCVCVGVCVRINEVMVLGTYQYKEDEDALAREPFVLWLESKYRYVCVCVKSTRNYTIYTICRVCLCY